MDNAALRVRRQLTRARLAGEKLSFGSLKSALMEILGRSQIGITMNIYSHVMPTQLVQAADAMNDVLWGERE